MGVNGIYTYVLSSSRIRHNEYFPLGYGLECSTVSKKMDMIVDGFCCLTHLISNEVFLELMLCHEAIYKYIENMFKWFNYLHFNVKFFIFDGMRPVKKDKTRIGRKNKKMNEERIIIREGYRQKNIKRIF